ncbi:Quinone oxidoreductase PIG3 [Brachionus plicatilis]|uniref:Quinone oxidoreductase PIG3 n=1 Tax=Brachionus plicatilis TaxID=10195 RepID=A0A3M7R3F7_BRAPC|nr:Quinone oxidoreductase PIG3 [Brachionus plicatilis]
MRAVAIRPPGLQPESLYINQRQIPSIKQNECLVKVVYSAINRADIMQRKGLYPAPVGESDILGLEAVGYVSQTKSSLWQEKARVMALVPGGGNAEYVAVNEKNLIRVPDWMSFRNAAAITEAWLTAFQLLFWISSVTKRELGRKPVEESTFLVHAGASGVGTSLIQILKKVLGAKNVFATCGSEYKKKYLEESLGVSRAFNYKVEENFNELVMNATGDRGVDVVFDCVGASFWQKNADCLAVDGEWIFYGAMGGVRVEGDFFSKILRKRIHLKATTLKTRSIDYKYGLIKDFESKVLDKFNEYGLEVLIDKEFELEQIGEAHKHMESNANIGKIIIKVSNPDTKQEL